MLTTTTGTNPGQPSWYCLRTQAKREHIAARNLHERVGVEVFAPRIRVARAQRNGVLASVAEALFPGYLFARFSFPNQLRHVVSTAGVSGIVSFGTKPPAVADDIIQFLRHQVRLAGQVSPTPLIEEGAWVKIVAGCFQEAEGKVLHFDPRTERVRLLLTLLGREVQVSLSAQQLVIVREPHAQYPSGLLAFDAAKVPAAS